MIRFKSIVTRLKNAIVRVVGIRPSWWKKIDSETPGPTTPLQVPIQGKAQTISLNPVQATALSDLEYALLTQAPLQLSALEKAKQDAGKIYFNRSSAYGNVSERPNGINVNGSAYPLPLGLKYVKFVFEAPTANSL